MEEVGNAGALESEILEAGRKKALRAVRDGEAKRAAFERDFMEGIAREEEAVRARFAARSSRRDHEAKARLPLERRRMALSRAELLLDEALRSFFSALPRDELLALLEPSLSRAKAEFSPSACGISYSGMSDGEAKALAERAGVPDAPRNPSTGGSSGLPEITFESDDTRMTVGIPGMIRALEEDHRGGLLAALVGKGYAL